MLATPFTPDGRNVDHVSLRRYCDEVIARGCSAVVALGVIGEPAALTEAERCAVVETVVATGTDVHVATMVGARSERLREAEALAHRFGDRIAGFLVPTTTCDPQELRTEVEQLHARTGRPVVLQDYPASSGVRIEVEDLVRAVSGLPGVAAIKCESAPTFARIRRLRALIPDVALMSGLGGLSLVDDLSQGARLVAAGTSRPEVVVDAVQAWLDGDAETARARVGAATAAIAFEIQQGTSIAIRKEHWRRQGVFASSAVRPPTTPYEPWLGALSDAHGFTDNTFTDNEEQ